MTFHKAVSVEAFPENGVAKASVDGREFAIIRLDGSFFAIDGLCRHAGGEVGDVTIVDGQLVCPIHEGRFDPKTGRSNPGDDWVSDVKCYPTKVEDGSIWLDL